MMFVGVRIEDGWFEVGFKAATRRDFEQHQRMIAAAAELFWPSRVEPPDLSRDPAEPPQPGDFAERARRAQSCRGHEIRRPDQLKHLRQ